MGAIGDMMALQDQEKIDQQAAAAAGQKYNPDGSAKANDYHPSALPQSAFPPGLAGGGGQLRVNRGSLSQVANQMASDLGRLQATLQTLYGGAGGATIGGWPTADGMGNNAGQAWYGISTFYQNLNDVYDQVIGYLHQTVHNYADAEDTTAAVARNVGSGA